MGPDSRSRFGHAMTTEATWFSYCSSKAWPLRNDDDDDDDDDDEEGFTVSGTGTLSERTIDAISAFARRVRRKSVRRQPWDILYFFLWAAESGPIK